MTIDTLSTSTSNAANGIVNDSVQPQYIRLRIATLVRPHYRTQGLLTHSID